MSRAAIATHGGRGKHLDVGAAQKAEDTGQGELELLRQRYGKGESELERRRQPGHDDAAAHRAGPPEPMQPRPAGRNNEDGDEDEAGEDREGQQVVHARSLLDERHPRIGFHVRATPP